jgi:hypothetical protein
MDWETIKHLLEIAELSRGHPQLKAIHDAALLELAQHAAPAEGTEIDDEEPTDE